jgi:hypothetical protein
VEHKRSSQALGAAAAVGAVDVAAAAVAVVVAAAADEENRAAVAKHVKRVGGRMPVCSDSAEADADVEFVTEDRQARQTVGHSTAAIVDSTEPTVLHYC